MAETNNGMIKLTSSNYAIWKPLMEDLLYCKDLADPIETKGVRPADKKEEEWNKLNRKAVGMIRQQIDISVFHHVAKETNAYDIWQKLQNMYERKTVRNKALLMRRLVNLRYKDGTSITEHMSNFQSLVNQLASVNKILDDEMQALLLLGTLPDSWETLVVSLSNSAPSGLMTMEMVQDALLNEEARRKEMGSQHSQALVTENKSQGRGRSRNRYNNRGNDRSKSRTRGQSKSWVKCFHCGLEGHMQRNCRKLKREQKQKDKQQKSEEENTAATTSEDIVLLSLEEEECLQLTDLGIEWVVDTAASYHATPNKEFFTSYRTGDFGVVKMGNSSYSKIEGIGDIQIQTSTGCTMVLKEVRHVPDLRLNLISGVALDCQGFTSQFHDGKWKLTKGSLIVARGQVVGNLYRTCVKICSDSLNTIEDKSSLNLWHRRLAHMSEKGLHMLAKKNLIPLDKSISLKPCEYCLFGKQHRVAFSSTTRRKSEKLNLVYSDVCGPIEVESMGGGISTS